jgi:6-phosphogluconolactonase
MKYVRQIFSLLVMAASVLLLGACGQKSNCNGISFGASGGSTGGSGAGGLNAGGSSCGAGSTNNGGGGSASDFLFFRSTSGPNDTIATAKLTATTFTVLTGVSVDIGQSIAESIVVVNKKFLYLPDQNGVLGFAISHSTGALTPLAGSPFPAPSTITTLSADPDSQGGRFLFAADFLSGNFMAFTINANTGALTLVPGSPFSNPTFRVTSLNVDGTGSYLYGTAGSTTGSVFGYSINQNSGALSPISGSPFPLGTGQVQINPAGTFLLSLASGGNAIEVIPIEAGTGALLVASTTSFPTVNSAGTVVMHPSGNFVYTCGEKFPMEGFQFSGGVLTELAGSPFTSLSNLTGCQFDQNGTALFGILLQSNEVGVRIVNPTTGAVLGGIPDLGVNTDLYFAVTN